MQPVTQSKRTLSHGQTTRSWWFVVLLLGVSILAHAQAIDTLWTRLITEEFDDAYPSLCVTQNSGFAVAFSVWSEESDWDWYLERFDENGNLLWIQSYDSASRSEFYPHVANTSDGGFILAGFSGVVGGQDNAGWVVKTDSFGNVMWDQVLKAYPATLCMSVSETEDGHFVTVYDGTTASGTHHLGFGVVWLDSNGDSLYGTNFPDNYDSLSRTVYTAIETLNGDIVVGGDAWDITHGFVEDSRSWVMRVSSSGDSLWHQILPGVNAGRIIELDDSSLIVALQDTSGEQSEPRDMLIAKLLSGGEIAWTREFGGPNHDGFKALCKSRDSGIVGIGELRLDSPNQKPNYLVWIDQNGDSLQSFMFWNNTEPVSHAAHLEQFGDTGYLAIIPRPYFGGPGIDLWIVAFGPTGSATEPGSSSYPNDLKLSTYPNPFNNTLTISLEIPLHQEVTLSLFDLLGREVDVIHHGRLNSSTLNYTAPTTLSSGIYFLHAATPTHSALQKVILLK